MAWDSPNLCQQILLFTVKRDNEIDLQGTMREVPQKRKSFYVNCNLFNFFGGGRITSGPVSVLRNHLQQAPGSYGMLEIKCLRLVLCQANAQLAAVLSLQPPSTLFLKLPPPSVQSFSCDICSLLKTNSSTKKGKTKTYHKTKQTKLDNGRVLLLNTPNQQANKQIKIVISNQNFIL